MYYGFSLAIADIFRNISNHNIKRYIRDTNNNNKRAIIIDCSEYLGIRNTIYIVDSIPFRKQFEVYLFETNINDVKKTVFIL